MQSCFSIQATPSRSRYGRFRSTALATSATDEPLSSAAKAGEMPAQKDMAITNAQQWQDIVQSLAHPDARAKLDASGRSCFDGGVLHLQGAHMPLNVSAQIVWAGDIPDQAGGLADKLDALAKAGANLEFVIARRRPEEPGKGVVFVSPVKGKKAEDAAASSGLSKAMDVPTLRVEGTDQPGI